MEAHAIVRNLNNSGTRILLEEASKGPINTSFRLANTAVWLFALLKAA